MVFKRFIGAALSTVLLLSSAQLSVFADQPSSTPDNTTTVSFTDVSEHWAKDAIARCDIKPRLRIALQIWMRNGMWMPFKSSVPPALW